jgi:hypothetical protein
MKIIIEQTKVAKPIEYDTVDIEIFMSDDGKVSSKNKEDIEKYENEERIKRASQEKFDSIQKIMENKEFSIYDRTYFFISTDEEFHVVFTIYEKCINPMYCYICINDRFVSFSEINSNAHDGNKWYSFQFVDGGDHRDHIDIYSESYIIEELERKKKELEKFKPIYEKYMKE